MVQAAGRSQAESSTENWPQLALGTLGSWGELLALGRKQRLEAGGLRSPEGEEACVLEASGSWKC